MTATCCCTAPSKSQHLDDSMFDGEVADDELRDFGCQLRLRVSHRYWKLHRLLTLAAHS